MLKSVFRKKTPSSSPQTPAEARLLRITDGVFYFALGGTISACAMHWLYANWDFVVFYLAFKGLI